MKLGLRLCHLARNSFSVQVLALFLIPASPILAAEFRFQHHFISRDLPIDQRGAGDYGLTALVDLDRDGDLDFVLGGRAVEARPALLV